MTPTPPAADWTFLQRIAFRFFFVYFVLYNLPFPLSVVPYGEHLVKPYHELWHEVVPWVGKHVLQLSYDITVRPNGSGDTTYNYVQVFCFAMLAAGATLLWSALDPRRRAYPKLHGGLRIYLRFSLACTMVLYGVVKIIQAQFPPPTLDRLIQPYGDSSPMGLLWTFMGYSEGYNIFAGAGELLGGLLLTTRRTTLLGALVSIGVLSHVVVLNFCYDVPVKLYSLHLLAMAVFLAAPDAPRLAHLFLFNRPVEPAPRRPLFRRKWLEYTGLTLRTLLFLSFVGWQLYSVYESRSMILKKSPLYGIWEVEEFVVDGQTKPPLMTEKTRWRRVVFDWPIMIAVQSMNDSRERYRAECKRTALIHI